MDVCGDTARLQSYELHSWSFLDGVRQVDVLCVSLFIQFRNLCQIATILAAHICSFKHHGLLDVQKLHIDLGL